MISVLYVLIDNYYEKNNSIPARAGWSFYYEELLASILRSIE